LSNGSFEVAIQANTGDLYTYNSNGTSQHVTLGMMAGTSPSIAPLSNASFEVAIQANTGDLYTYNSTGTSQHVTLDMKARTSPSLL